MRSKAPLAELPVALEPSLGQRSHGPIYLTVKPVRKNVHGICTNVRFPAGCLAPAMSKLQRLLQPNTNVAFWMLTLFPKVKMPTANMGPNHLVANPNEGSVRGWRLTPGLAECKVLVEQLCLVAMLQMSTFTLERARPNQMDVNVWAVCLEPFQKPIDMPIYVIRVSILTIEGSLWQLWLAQSVTHAIRHVLGCTVVHMPQIHYDLGPLLSSVSTHGKTESRVSWKPQSGLHGVNWFPTAQTLQCFLANPKKATTCTNTDTLAQKAHGIWSAFSILPFLATLNWFTSIWNFKTRWPWHCKNLRIVWCRRWTIWICSAEIWSLVWSIFNRQLFLSSGPNRTVESLCQKIFLKGIVDSIWMPFVTNVWVEQKANKN